MPIFVFPPAAAYPGPEPCRRRPIRPPGKCAGFSLFELAVVAIVLSCVALVFANRLAYYEEMAEKADVEYTVSALKSVLRLKMASMIFEGRAQEFGSLAYSNPMDWLDQKPTNYAGKFDSRSAALVPEGSWYFDVDQRMLVYRIRRHAYFSSAGRQEIRIRVEPVRSEQRKDNQPADGDTVAIRYMESYK